MFGDDDNMDDPGVKIEEAPREHCDQNDVAFQKHDVRDLYGRVPDEAKDFVEKPIKKAIKNYKPTAFQKHDEGKRRYDLIPYDALEEIIKALEHGAEEYSDWNWLKGTVWSRYFAPAMRHLTAWWMGESRDAESGLSHLAHAGACILFLITYEKRLLGKDDRVTPTGD